MMVPPPVKFGMEVMALQMRLNQAYLEGFTKGFEKIYNENVDNMNKW